MKAPSPEEPEEKDQVKLDAAVGSASKAEVLLDAERASMALRAAFVEAVRESGTVPVVKKEPPVMATESTDTATVSVMSKSVTVIEPEEERVVLVSVRDAVSGALVMTGVSLVPVMVTATVVVEAAAASEPVAELLSVSVRV